MKNYLLGFFFACISMGIAHAQLPDDGGLYFSSHEVNQDLRTSLNLTPTQPFLISDGFSLAFKAKFRPGDGYFGYIFRIIADGADNIDLVANLLSDDANFWLVFGDDILVPVRWSDFGGINYDWLDFNISVDNKKNEIHLNINGNDVVGKMDRPPGHYRSFEVVFGAHNFAEFVSTDVAPMSIRNVSVHDGARQIANWKMDKHRQTTVVDELQGRVATVSNPNWLIDRHIRWEFIHQAEIPGIRGTVADLENSILYLVGKHYLFTYDLSSKQVNRLTYNNGGPFDCQFSHLVFDPESDHIVSYSFESSLPNVLDLNTLNWSQSPSPCGLPNYWHHNTILYGNKLMAFGGYGNFSYKNVLQTLDLENGGWTNQHLTESIEPRYLAASGMLPNTDFWYIFGGYGSKSGAQEAAPRNFYDLQRINLQTGKSEKVWELEKDFPGHFVPADRLVPTPEGDGFYTLLYDHSQFNTSLVLAKISTDEATIEFYSDSIPYSFRDIRSWATLYHFPELEQLIAVTNHQNSLGIYALNSPALTPLEVIQPPFAPNENHLWKFALAIAAVLAALGLRFFSQKKAAKTVTKTGTSLETEFSVPQHIRPSVSAIYFLGGFQAFDKNGINITAEFTPTLKQLFFLIYFNSALGEKGITSVKLKEYIWPDKSEVSAKNNRNVNISKLRVLLEHMGDVQVNNHNGYWKIEATGIYVDFEEAMHALNALREKDNESLRNLPEWIKIFSYGELCPNVQAEWIDPIKVNFANATIDALLYLMDNDLVGKEDPQLLLEIADTLLIHDMLNEEALRLKCSTLIRLGKKGLAVQTYERFAKEYEKMMGVPYDTSIVQLCE
ncbi:MAG: hypothetical protein JJU34_01585 [Lunatimonas sp.]|uniref:hypothetical protein n=1 Tax=Lunatimonas sp. TaxID=2060141 RepID=UPI00263B4125|nr:hypothetical protein [Lunatimonas sp.]MCC5935949.1 hypothetical protein [Lunatimonas sp.]